VGTGGGRAPIAQPRARPSALDASAHALHPSPTGGGALRATATKPPAAWRSSMGCFEVCPSSAALAHREVEIGVVGAMTRIYSTRALVTELRDMSRYRPPGVGPTRSAHRVGRAPARQSGTWRSGWPGRTRAGCGAPAVRLSGRHVGVVVVSWVGLVIHHLAERAVSGIAYPTPSASFTSVVKRARSSAICRARGGNGASIAVAKSRNSG